jgi:hypothetical protein
MMLMACDPQLLHQLLGKIGSTTWLSRYLSRGRSGIVSANGTGDIDGAGKPVLEALVSPSGAAT